MHIFIDTTALYSDPFWKQNYHKQLIEAAIDHRVTILISDVVLRELRINLEKQLDKEYSSIISSNATIRKLTRIHDELVLPEKDKFLKDFDRFYNYLFDQRNIIKLAADKDNFEEILERAINKKKPFSESRSEFKDAVIWVTYFKFAKANSIINCHLITNNIKDFYDTSDKLHKDLLDDYDKFTLHKSINEFYKLKVEEIDKPIREFQKWIKDQNLDEDYIYELLYNNETDKVFEEVTRRYNHIDPSHIVEEKGSGGLLGGYVEVDAVEWQACKKLVVDIVKDYAIISGELIISVTLELFGYNSVRDPGDEKFPYFTSIDMELTVDFNFVYDKDDYPKNFEVTRIS